MCGIAGVVDLVEGLPEPDLSALERMAGALRHRGPDEAGLFRDVGCALVHTRLSVVDLASGQQPMCNEDGSLWGICNGEIFNHLELRARLEGMGHVFRTRCDSEVILHAWEAWGEEACARFNGQFAFALWDRRRRTLVLARDPLGIRPLHLCAHGGRLLFASEVKGLFAFSNEVPRAWDPEGLDQTFTFWSVVAPRTVFSGVEELPPGHLRTVRGGNVRTRRYWALGFPEAPGEGFSGSLDEAVEAVEDALEKATRRRMLCADVPVGSYLSGGLDSSLVAAWAATMTPRLRTFSLRFEDPTYDEGRYQEALCRQLGVEHETLLVRPEAISAALPEVIRHTERPILRTAPVPLFLLSERVRRAGMKVVLTGEGADELFGGYDLFREAKVRAFWARQPSSTLRPRLLERLYPWLSRSPARLRQMGSAFFGQGLSERDLGGFSHQPRWRTTAALKRLFGKAFRARLAKVDSVAALLGTLPEPFARWSPLSRAQWLEVRTLLSGYLLASQGDRVAMAHSVEGRFPFLDLEVIALANSLPPWIKLRGLSEKHVLKKVARGKIPQAILARKKQPYRAPDAACFVGKRAPDWVAELLSPGAVETVGVFDARAVDQLRAKCERATSGPFSNSDDMALVGVLSTQLLHRELMCAAKDAPRLPLTVRGGAAAQGREPGPRAASGGR